MDVALSSGSSACNAQLDIPEVRRAQIDTHEHDGGLFGYFDFDVLCLCFVFCSCCENGWVETITFSHVMRSEECTNFTDEAFTIESLALPSWRAIHAVCAAHDHGVIASYSFVDVSLPFLTVSHSLKVRKIRSGIHGVATEGG
jgi:hypothetical protein